ncbi:MAG: tRNA uridine-5-carboxymethylaminomethyl(34) synthesis GTPase MnmE, partial [Deltaproteobacteria bacterium]|nr:tRNA uridine-5-carboxymethylaminomethyl(34) synthesis GTPase MnmE [Deltaproteobacteria bacterium]
MIVDSIDTIAAIATATGVGGVGIVRLSGPRAVAIASTTLGIAPDVLGREVRVGWVRDTQGVRLDQVIAFAMRAPHSFTGEDVAEIHGHGGTQNLAQLLALVVEHGARLAEPGEFTRRAVEHGKLDLVRAEALLGVIHAGSERAWRLAQHNLSGKLGGHVLELERQGLTLLAEIEGRIDFPEDDLEPERASWIAAQLATLATALTALADGFRHGRVVNHGITVALVGPVNVGKSSLLNALVGTERALVAAAPGTTRDYLEARTEWDGVAVTLVDTAGLRDTTDPVERRGIELGEERVAAADVVVVVDDESGPPHDAARYG